MMMHLVADSKGWPPRKAVAAVAAVAAVVVGVTTPREPVAVAAAAAVGAATQRGPQQEGSRVPMIQQTVEHLVDAGPVVDVVAAAAVPLVVAPDVAQARILHSLMNRNDR